MAQARATSKAKAKPKAGVLKANLMHQGRIIPAGEKAPSDLSADQIERLERLGVL